MNKKTKIYFLFLFITLLITIVFGIITKNSFKGNIYFKELLSEDNLDDYQVQVYPVNEYFDNNITDIHDLEKKSDLIAKVQVQENRKLFLQSTKTKVKIICKYYGSDDYKEGSIIYIEEPSVFLKLDSLTYDVTYGYQIMEDNKEYIVFLKNLEKVDNYKYKNDEKYTFIPVSTLYAKYPLEKEDVKVIEQSKVEQGECKYGDIKNNSILSFKLEEVEKFKNFLDTIEQEYLK